MEHEEVTLSLARFLSMKQKEDFFDSEYVAMRCPFLIGFNPDASQMWVKDEVLSELEKEYRAEAAKHKKRFRFMFKFWKWRVIVKLSK